MKTFILNVLASLVGGIFLIFAASFFSWRLRRLLTGLVARMLGVDIDYVYNNKTQAETELKSELIRAKDIAVFTSRGNELQRGAFASIFLERPERRRPRVRILLPKTALQPGEYDWVSRREQELASFDHAFGNRLLHRQIDTNVDFLEQHIKSGIIELRRYNYPHIGRIIVTIP